MHLKNLHRWDVSPTEAIAIQRDLAASIEQGPPLFIDNAKIIAGIDVSSSKFDPDLTAGIVVWNRITEKVIETTFAKIPATFPYVPGLLSFREVPAISLALEKLKTVPDVFFVDGQGRAHPRRLGIASHIGLLIDVATVGVGKSRLTGKEIEPAPTKGSFTGLMDGSEEIGRVLRTKERSKPLYISVGNHITLESATELVIACLRGYRLPEPTRLAHNHVSLVRTTGVGLRDIVPKS